MKIKVSISLDEELVDHIDALVGRSGESRSEAIQRLCMAGLECEGLEGIGAELSLWMTGPAGEVRRMLAQTKPEFPDEMIELLIRRPREERLAALKRGKGKG